MCGRATPALTMTTDEARLAPLLTADEVARLLHVAVGTVRNWARERRLPSTKVNGALRFRPADIQGVIERGTREPQDTRP
jgi:excisionase family DNA binding protein